MSFGGSAKPVELLPRDEIDIEMVVPKSYFVHPSHSGGGKANFMSMYRVDSKAETETEGLAMHGQGSYSFLIRT